MKKNLAFFLFILFFTSHLFSQEALKQGSFSVGGAISLSSSSNESDFGETESLDILMTPSISYFISDYFAAGISLSFGYFELEWRYYKQELKSISRPIAIGPLLRYYFTFEKINPFIEASYNYSNSLQGNQDQNSYSIGCGINYFLTKSVALEPYINYKLSHYIIQNQKINTISVGVRLNFFMVE